MELDRAIEKEMIVKLVVCSFKYMYYDGEIEEIVLVLGGILFFDTGAYLL